jgi:hypothetical protein
LTKATKRWVLNEKKPTSAAKAKSSKTPEKILEIKITLQEVKPTVWRTIAIDVQASLEDLHQAIQLSMGWQFAHLYAFSIVGKRGRVTERYSSNDFQLDGTESTEKTKLADLVEAGVKEFQYEYDFGDSWEHTIKILGALKAPEAGKKYPICLDGAMACPPEDCGGTPGYENLMAVMSNPKDPEYKEMKEWLGKKFDPTKFSLTAANKALKEIQN